MTVDQDLLDAAVAARTPWLVDAVTVLTHSGGTVALLTASTAIVVALWIRGDVRAAAFVATVMLSGWAVMSASKLVFARERPPIPERLIEISTYSFPSGHAMMTAMFAGVMAFLLVRTGLPIVTRAAALVCLGLYTLAIGLSRIYLGAHWATDIVTGWALGALWSGVFVVLAVRAGPVVRRVRRGGPSVAATGTDRSRPIRLRSRQDT